ncbi:MAG TPA: sugar-binding transcriptional regulator [Desulfomicrobiaceae bacterium]|nr:sugar-binding transcriptional regulator [Desulfomicrobiaceae bacterium]
MERDEELMTRVAWAYYNEELTQAEIASRLGLTRARVNRMLQECRESGLVQILINSETAGCVALERRLERRYGLVKAVVVPTPARENKLYAAIGMAAGMYVSESLRDGQSLGLGWGKTLRAAARGIRQRPAGDLAIVSLFGGLPHSATTNPYDVASVFARTLSAAECYFIAAPMYVSSEEVREVLMSQTMFDEVFERAAEVDMALVGAGDLTSRSTNVVLGALTRDEWRSLLDVGAAGEIFGYFLDGEGNLVDHPLNNRFMGGDFGRLRNIPCKVVASGGAHKAGILRAVLEGGYANVFITDELAAKAVLDQEGT